ncbi:hypothetical protein HanHA300_Chr13g0474801 [Helianthus annuus]|nr:hypothetical protein HanHA300_Chr13g0474801 [Helianthus annuus]KAJ0480323.1 hypothetical protein HanIR_Chr13g0630311 [Helianthus annuus]KAJ0497025.1 hypothetical protein HanHA89_Chr13g0506721 [Helianthus annuus]
MFHRVGLCRSFNLASLMCQPVVFFNSRSSIVISFRLCLRMSL